jgi:hypothetical protein
MNRFCLTLVLSASVFAFCHLGAAQQSIDGTWEGVASTDPNETISFSIFFKTEGGTLKGTIDIPDLGVAGLALSDLSFDGKTLSFTVPLPEGAVPCTASLNEDGSISGTYDDRGQTGTFTMRKTQKKPWAAATWRHLPEARATNKCNAGMPCSLHGI